MIRHDDPRDLELLSAEAEEQLQLALRMALAPTELDARLNERLIAAAFEDPLAPPTEEELVASARLREALDGAPPTADARLAAALAASMEPSDLDEQRAARLAARALARGPRHGNVVYVAFASAVVVTAAAAAAALLVFAPAPPRSTPPAAAFVSSRSTTELFAEKFEVDETSRRVDRIAEARQRDLRENRYLAWGVK